MTIEQQAQAVQAVPGTIGVYTVPSASLPWKYRRVNINTEECDCPGIISARKAHGTCRHIKAVYLWVYWQLSEVQQRAAESVLSGEQGKSKAA